MATASLRDELFWLALTVFQEAAGEPYVGKLGVAFVIINRAVREGRDNRSISDTVLARLQFSCWNSDSPTRRRVDVSDDTPSWRNSYKAACAAYFGLVTDPTKGSNHYLNPSVLPKLPSWYNRDKVTVTLGAHEFLKL